MDARRWIQDTRLSAVALTSLLSLDARLFAVVAINFSIVNRESVIVNRASLS